MPSVLILVSAILYGASPILAKVAYGYGMSTLTLLAVRSAFATACLWLGLAASGRSVRVPSSSLAALLVTGTTLIPVQVFGYFWALGALPASSASVLIYTFPLHVAWMGGRARCWSPDRHRCLPVGVSNCSRSPYRR